MSPGNRKITRVRQTFYAVCSTIEANTLWNRFLTRQTHNHLALYHNASWHSTWSDVTAVEISAQYCEEWLLDSVVNHAIVTSPTTSFWPGLSYSRC